MLNVENETKIYHKTYHNPTIIIADILECILMTNFYMQKMRQVQWLIPIIATQEAEMRSITVQGQPRQKVPETPSQSVAKCPCHSSYAGNIGMMMIVIQTTPSIKQDPISKITNTRRAGGLAQLLKHLPSKCKPLSSNSSGTGV
jgi:hypothetical protein